MHKQANLLKGALAIKDNNDPVIIIDPLIESPIRIIRNGDIIESVYADTLEEVDIETWRKAIAIKLNSQG